MPWTLWIYTAILTERPLPAIEDGTSPAMQTEITQNATVKLSRSSSHMDVSSVCPNLNCNRFPLPATHILLELTSASSDLRLGTHFEYGKNVVERTRGSREATDRIRAPVACRTP